MDLGEFRRSVFGAVTAYGAGAFVALQAADLFLPALLFPDWVFRFLVIVALLGLPVTAITVWLLKRGAVDKAPSASTSGRPRRTRTRLAFGFVVVLAIVGGGAAFANVRPEDIPVRERDWIVLAD